MQTWLALLRGVNVGGRNLVSMKALAASLEVAGFQAIQTYLQSGNVIIDSPIRSRSRLADCLCEVIHEGFGFRPSVFMMTKHELAGALAANPFMEAVREPKSLHFVFLDSALKTFDRDGLEQLATATERFELIGRVFYLYAPDGIGRSKLAAGVERKLGVATTARNYNTCRKLATMLGIA
ncbi:MAG: DUF1697 domain-containing protein [Planctomycetales bacterium]|nr:DUF1697 domain-containing protein [Planctomycetales bacterium]